MADTPAARAEQNVIQVFRVWSASSGGRSWDGEGFSCVSSPVPQRSFNQIFVTSPAVGQDALAEAIAWFRDNGRPLRVRAYEEAAAAIDSMAEVLGLQREGGLPCMTFTGSLPPPTATDLRIERVADGRMLHDMLMVVGEAFDWAVDDLNRVFTPALLDAPGWYGWVGYAGDEPAASSQLLVHDSVAGLYDVGTTAAHRRKGYGEAITRVAVAQGLAQDCDIATLYASNLGRPVYERLGFLHAGELLTFVPAA